MTCTLQWPWEKKKIPFKCWALGLYPLHWCPSAPFSGCGPLWRAAVLSMLDESFWIFLNVSSKVHIFHWQQSWTFWRRLEKCIWIYSSRGETGMDRNLNEKEIFGVLILWKSSFCAFSNPKQWFVITNRFQMAAHKIYLFPREKK